jgi:hypothetical protein
MTSENQLQRELHLPRSVRGVSRHKIGGLSIVRRKVSDSNRFIQLHKISRSTGEAIIGDDYPLIVAIQRIERFGN